MKSILLSPFMRFSLLLVLICMASCIKKKDQKASFTWTYKGNTQLCETPHAEIIDGIYHQIHGEKSPSNAMHLYPQQFNTGTYMVDVNDTFNSALLIYEQAIDTIIFLLPESGTIHITENKDNKLSGDFSLLSPEGDPITGTFQNVPTH